MTHVGHILTGLSVGALAIPFRAAPAKKVALLGAFGVASMMPDVTMDAVRGWSGLSYALIHSLVWNLPMMLLVLGPLVVWPRSRRWLGCWVPAGLAFAWGSHLLLDTMYAHDIGIPLLYPLSTERFSLAVPWLHICPGGFANPRWLRITLTEIATFAPLSALCLILRWTVIRRYRADASPREQLRAPG